MQTEAQILPNEAQARERARATTRDFLATSPAFKAMPVDEQKDIYLALVQENMAKEMSKSRGPARNGNGLAKPFATDTGGEMGYKGYDPGFTGDTRAFRELVDSVDFPKFVADLMQAVFDGNLKVMKTQTDTYIKLMKEATKSTADFIKKVKDDDAFAKLAESNSSQFNVTTEKAADGSTKLALTNPDGDKVDLEDAAVKQALFDAKLKMAQEHRAALREVLLMGVTRLIVKKGEIEAGVEFNIKASRESKAHHEDQNVNVATLDTEYELPLGGLFGGPSASLNVQNTNIQINTSDKKATDDLSAKLMGKVKIEFATDYFKLDNFLTMYGAGGVAGLAPAAGAAPPPVAAPAR
jgi:hypothetical protein